MFFVVIEWLKTIWGINIFRPRTPPPKQSQKLATQGTILYPWDVRFLKDKRDSSEKTLNNLYTFIKHYFFKPFITYNLIIDSVIITPNIITLPSV